MKMVASNVWFYLMTMMMVLSTGATAIAVIVEGPRLFVRTCGWVVPMVAMGWIATVVQGSHTLAMLTTFMGG